MQDNNFCRLGEATFGVKDGISGFEIETGYDYAQHDLATGKPTLQPMGETLSQVNIDIVLRNYIGHDVPGTIETLDKLRASGESQKLVFGSGAYQGNYVIRNIRSKVVRTDASGVIQSADLTLSLIEFADRETQTRKKTETRPTNEKQQRTLITE